jgi:nucleotide-binding universal stress UspA family protein
MLYRGVRRRSSPHNSERFDLSSRLTVTILDGDTRDSPTRRACFAVARTGRLERMAAKNTPRPIMAAVDFSENSAKALAWAAIVAERFDAPLLAVHVVHDPGSAPGYYHQVKKAKKHLQRIEERAEEMMIEFLDGVREEHPELEALATLESELVIGLPVNRILEVAEKRDACQIVLGSRGRTGLPSLLLGSKALKVAQLARVPVTIVKDRPEGQA